MWPKKKKVDAVRPSYFRSTDKHWQTILENYKSVANQVRARGDDLPKGVRKRKQRVNEWV